MKVEWHRAAQIELQDAARFYDDAAEGLGDEFLQEIDRAIKRIEMLPETWEKVTSRSRRVLAQRFPYAIIYQLQNDYIFIVAVAHLRRYPRYWSRRPKQSED